VTGLLLPHSGRLSDQSPYSHSIINEPSKLLICQHPETVPQKFTVILTVKVRSTSIGAGLRAIRQEATFRDLSTSIDSSNHRGHRRRRIGVGQGNDQEGPASNTLSYCPDSLFRPNFCPQRSGRSGAAPQHFGWAIGVQPSPPDHRSWVHAMSSTGAGGRGNSPTTVASYAGAASRGDTLRAMSSRVAKVFRS
jgi:hypothetical protein